MLNDAELIRLREGFFQACVPLTYSRDVPERLAWADVLLDPSPATIRELMSHVRGDGHWILLGELVEIGIAHAADVLVDLPLPIDDVPDRRWQLRRELARIVAGMSDEQLQQLVYRARSIADV